TTYRSTDTHRQPWPPPPAHADPSASAYQAAAQPLRAPAAPPPLKPQRQPATPRRPPRIPPPAPRRAKYWTAAPLPLPPSSRGKLLAAGAPDRKAAGGPGAEGMRFSVSVEFLP